jgi:hypothetical protein
MHPSLAVFAVHWLAAVGGMFVFVGSGLQAVQSLNEYKSELEALDLPEQVKEVLGSAVKASSFGGAGPVVMMLAVGIAAVRVAVNWQQMTKESQEKARRLRALTLEGAIWAYIMYGGLFLTGAAGVQLVVDYGVWPATS